MAKTQPKIEDIKDLRNVLDNLDYEDLGDMPVATSTKVGGIKLGFTPTPGTDNDDALPIQLDDDDKAYVYIGYHEIKNRLGLTDYSNYNKQDIFISGIPTTPHNDFDSITYIGSYKVSGGYYNAPDPDCGTNRTIGYITASMKGTLNVFRSGSNNWETIQQLFWVLNGVTEQYQRSYGGDGTTWTDWKRLIKCDDYADPTTGKGGIISAANLSELFRAPDLIQLWNDTNLELSNGIFYLDDLSIEVPIENVLHLDGKDIAGLTSNRRYRVTYEVQCVRKKGEGWVSIRIKDGEDEELYSRTGYMFESNTINIYTFSVILTNTNVIRPSIEVDSKLDIEIYSSSYQVSVEEIKFPQFNPNN